MAFKASLALSIASAFAGATLAYVGLSGASDTQSHIQLVTPVSVSTTKPAPSKYCKKADLGKRVKYTTPSGSATYYLVCTKKTTQAWKKATK
jgi:hypothetical protein